MARIGTNLRDCFEPNKLTEKELDAISTIIDSQERRKMILEILIRRMCEISSENTVFVSSLLSDVITKFSSQVDNKIHTMRHSLEMVGPMMYDMIRRKLDIPDYELLLYIRTTWDWKQMYEDSIYRNDRHMVKTSEIVRGIEFADLIVDQFRKLINRIDLSKPLIDGINWQVPMGIIDLFPDTLEFLTWCKEHRDLWDDLPENWTLSNETQPTNKAKKK